MVDEIVGPRSTHWERRDMHMPVQFFIGKSCVCVCVWEGTSWNVGLDGRILGVY
jgi:hypothetical protein